MIFSTVAINAVNRVSGGKRLFLASLQQTCNEYLYLNINKSKLAFLLQKSSGDFWVIWLMFSIFSIFSLFSMLPMFSKLTPCSPIRDGRMERVLQPCHHSFSGVSWLYLEQLLFLLWTVWSSTESCGVSRSQLIITSSHSSSCSDDALVATNFLRSKHLCQYV